MVSMKRLILICPWFGAWPPWINFFIESCRHNPDIDWLIFTDQDAPENSAPNVILKMMPFDAFKERVASALSVEMGGIQPYKIVDFRPFYGLIFAREIEDYKSFGYCDMDVIWGDIRSIYTDELLDSFDAISAHDDKMSGHLSVFRNSKKMRSFGTIIKDWRSLLQDPNHRNVDEKIFSRYFRPKRRHLIRYITRPKSLFVERHTTPGHPHKPWPDIREAPRNWLWKDGRLTNERFSSGILYLHFMTWHSNRWRKGDMVEAPWPNLPSVVQCDWRTAARDGFLISPEGIRSPI